MISLPRLASFFIFFAVSYTSLFAEESPIAVGVGVADITPNYPIRLSGYGGRRTESEGVSEKLWAKALAIGEGKDTAVLVMVDNCAVQSKIRDEVASRLAARAGLSNDRFTLCSTHTHTGPCLSGVIPNLFSQDIPPAQQATIDRYTLELTDRIEQAALDALLHRYPRFLSWTEGKLTFAKNRRTNGGPVDDSFQMLRVTDTNGKVRAIVANYACHCTTLSGEFNQIHGDWAGYAQECIQRDYPGATALITIGCGADANPDPRNQLDQVHQHGEQVAREVTRLLSNPMKPLRPPLDCQIKHIDLPFDKLPTREQWEERAKQSGIVGYHARNNLKRLDKGEHLPTTLPYTIQTWRFGNDLTMIFLAGEVVVDYASRLKQELDSSRVWITAYANDVPCYIPSRRILKEGGYEAEESLWYYDRPARLAPEIEDMIVAGVHDLVSKDFLFDAKKAEFPPPKSPEESLASIQTKAGLVVELAAAEPLVVDPVAIDFGADGKLWVVEMRDFPMGMDGKWKPGGRVKFLEDLNSDGVYDRATVFLDEVPFPTGITAWKNGVLICAAPDILYAEDTDGDGRADKVEKLYSGFATDNYQARVNSLSLGLDNWIYGANGLIGGTIRSAATGQTLNIRGRDFRIHPENGAFETASGLTQQGRVRDDFDNWFGCDNSTLLWHYPLPDQYLRRNSHVAPPDPRVAVADDADPNQLYPISHTLRRFNDPQHANRVTSACGLGIYRDILLGDEFYGNAFLCEPVHNLVHRLVLSNSGVTFSGHRAFDEQSSEFLASTDNWFRPVQVRAGPDGALYVVDMYRFVVEHPRWITPDRLKELNLRAGDDKGRIYRVRPQGKPLRPIRNLRQLDTSTLARSLNHPNGIERDRIHLELLRRNDKAALPWLKAIATQSGSPASRIQALSVLEGLHGLEPSLVATALADPSAVVRKEALKRAEAFTNNSSVTRAMLKLAADPDADVQLQMMLSLGAWTDKQAQTALIDLATKTDTNQWLRAAYLSSANEHASEILGALLKPSASSIADLELIAPLISTAIGSESPSAWSRFLPYLAGKEHTTSNARQLAFLGSLLEALERRGQTLAGLHQSSGAQMQPMIDRLEQTLQQASQWAINESEPEPVREATVRLLGYDRTHEQQSLEALLGIFDSSTPLHLQRVALESLERLKAPQTSARLLARWPHYSPAQRLPILETLLRREDWTLALVAEIEAGKLSASDIPATFRQRLLKHSNTPVRDRATALFRANAKESRSDVVEKFKSVLQMAGNSDNGRIVFSRNCASCHEFRGQGTAVGPNLAALTDKRPQFLLTAILDPNAAVEDRFMNYSIETRDGRSLSGIIASETANSITLASGTANRETVLRSNIAEIRASQLSLMPEGLEQAMSVQDLADLIAHLQHTPAGFGTASVDQAAKARSDFMAGVTRSPVTAVGGTEKLPYPSWMGTLPMPYCRQTNGKSKLAWEAKAVGSSAASRYRFTFPVAMGFASQPAGQFEMKINGRSAARFDVALDDKIWLGADEQVRIQYSVVENNTEDSDGILTVEVPEQWLPSSKTAAFEVTGSEAGSQRWFGLYLVE